MFIKLQSSLVADYLNCSSDFYGPVEIYSVVFIFTINLNLMEKQYSKKRAMKFIKLQHFKYECHDGVFVYVHECECVMGCYCWVRVEDTQRMK